MYYNAIHKAVVHEEWHLCFSCCRFKHIPQRVFLVSEISFSTSSKGYLSWEEAPEEEAVVMRFSADAMPTSELVMVYSSSQSVSSAKSGSDSVYSLSTSYHYLDKDHGCSNIM